MDVEARAAQMVPDDVEQLGKELVQQDRRSSVTSQIAIASRERTTASRPRYDTSPRSSPSGNMFGIRPSRM